MIVLAADGKSVLAEGTELKVDMVIDYLTTIDQKKRSGIVDKFYSRTLERKGDSVWMLVRDLNGGENEVISIRNWINALQSGAIRN